MLRVAFWLLLIAFPFAAAQSWRQSPDDISGETIAETFERALSKE